MDLNEVGVDSPGELRGVFQQRADSLQRHGRHVATKQHDVRVTHRDAGQPRFEAARGLPIARETRDFGQRQIDNSPCGESRWDRPGFEDRLAHVDANPLGLAGFSGRNLQGEHASAGLEGDLWTRGDAVVVNVLRDAANAVSAHFRFATIGIEHPHPRIGPLAGTDQNEAIASNPGMAVGDQRSQNLRGRGERFREQIDVDVVVPRPVHLRKPQHQRSPI